MTVCVSASGITELNCCQLHLVYNGPNGKQARFYFCLIQQENNSRGRILLSEAPQAVKGKQRRKKETPKLIKPTEIESESCFNKPGCHRVIGHILSKPSFQRVFLIVVRTQSHACAEWYMKHLIMGCCKQINCCRLTSEVSLWLCLQGHFHHVIASL